MNRETGMDERANAYETVARAIRFIKSNAREQPSLAAVALHVGLSEFHLQRVFAAWAGISPKRFLQVLTVEHAKQALRTTDVLGAALNAGLSGPSRLHDLTIACDAMTPGEVRSGGAGIQIGYGFADSPFGRAIVGVTDRGVCHLQFTENVDESARVLFREWPRAQFVRDDARARSLMEILFAAAPGRALHVFLKGTNFQVQVWKALVRVPSGAMISYGNLASAVGRANASRAVGSAVAKNSVALLIPCHRVIREGGDLGGYRWGAERKAAVLAWEARSPGP